MSDQPAPEDLVQTNEDIPEIPEGVAVSNSVGEEVPDEETPEPVEYGDEDLNAEVEVDPDEPVVETDTGEEA